MMFDAVTMIKRIAVKGLLSSMMMTRKLILIATRMKVSTKRLTSYDDASDDKSCCW